MRFTKLLEDIKEQPATSKTIIEKNGRFFVRAHNGRSMGAKLGYNTLKEAVYGYYFEALSTFKHMDMVRQEEMVNKYIKNHRLGKT
jgi:hypothetical protein